MQAVRIASRRSSCQHIVDDGLWVLVARVVAREDHLVALSDGLLRHERSLAVVAVASGSTDGDDLSLAVEHLVDGREHVGDGVRGVGVIDDGGESLRRPDRLQASADAAQRAHGHEHGLCVFAQQYRRGIDREQVAHVEASDKLHADLLAVDLEVHSLEVALQDARPVVGHALDGVGLDARLAVLHHEESVLVVSVGDGEGRLRQHVEEHLLGVAVVFERLVIV